MLDTVAGYMQKVACMIPDGVKKIWHDATKLYEKIPTEAKFAIGFIDGAIAWGTGETRKFKNPTHSQVTGLQRRVINIIKKQ